MPLPETTTSLRRVLFVCIHNSARSQIAEAFLNRMPGFVARSAGLEKGKLNPVVVEAMNEIGIDISANETITVDSILNSEEHFDYVITVCDEANVQRCPAFPGSGQHLHWPFHDASALVGSKDERLRATRTIRDAIAAQVKKFAGEHAAEQ
jgi:arsenate reductase (thioredoxin)